MDSLLGGWENFYVIVGTSAGGLTGLTFVVIALIRDASKVTPTGLGAFVTPTIVHFGGAGIRRQAVSYTPVLEDWLFNFIVPALVYAVLLTAAVTIRIWPATTLFAVASAALVTLFVGIHNAWDIAVFMATRTPPAAPPSDLT
ncbi:MAG TPA: hypothetical protein VET66_13285 [Steroidobacteraceae bacterium]|nr:hypothetical protein [Steroidobacteraceae bacterium]